jgi:hypothetical protein
MILPFEHWCADGCGEVLERKGSLTRVRRWKIVLENGKTVGIAFESREAAEKFLKEHADSSSH